MNKVAAIVGMTGSGKSVVSEVFLKNGFMKIRFGDITDKEILKRGLPLNEANERSTREALRKQYGMAAYAFLNKPVIDEMLQVSDVVADGLYSWEEYNYLRGAYGDALIVVAVWSSPATRYARLGTRKIRPLTAEEAASRDRAEIENLNKGGPIAMADYTIINEFSHERLTADTEKIINEIRQG